MTLGTSTSSTTCQTCGCAGASCEDCQTPSECTNCAPCCCSGTHQTWRIARFRNGIRIECLRSAWMIIEVFGSIGFGMIAGSFGLLAFGGDSVGELICGI